jgi:template-activating factor I
MSKNASAPQGGNSNQVTDLSPEVKAKLDALEQEHDFLMIKDRFDSIYKLATYYEKRREKLKAIPEFWPTVLQNDAVLLSVYGNHAEDLEAIKYVEDIWIAREKPDPRAYTVEMVNSLVYELVQD